MASVRNYTDTRVKVQLERRYPQAMTADIQGRRGGDVSRELQLIRSGSEPGTAGLCQRDCDGTAAGNPPSIRGYLAPLGYRCGRSGKQRWASTVAGWEWKEIARRQRENRDKWSCASADRARLTTWC